MRTSTRYLVSAVALILLVATLAVFSAARRQALFTTDVGQASPAMDFRFSWPRGTTYLYELTWGLAQTSRLGEAAVAGRVDLVGTIELRSYGEHQGATLLGLRFPALSRAHLELAGRPLLGDPDAAVAALVGPEVFVEVAPTGLVRSVFVPSTAPPVFTNVVKNLLGDLEVVVPTEPDATWTASAHLPAGAAVVRYRALGGAAPSLERRVESYSSLVLLADAGREAHSKVESAGQVDLAAAGHVSNLSLDEALVANAEDGRELAESRDHLRLSLLSLGHFEPGAGPSLASCSREVLGQVVATADSQRRLLEARADGMTGEMLLNDLATQAATGRLLDHARWMWRAVAVLRLHPELCADLIPLFLEPTTGVRGRALLLDLLASTGHAEAQSAVRAMLATSVATSDSHYGQLLQRTSVLAQPEAETVAFVRETYASARRAGNRELAKASLYAYGATGGKRPAAEGAKVSAELRTGLAQAESSSERAAYLMALGNSARDEDVVTIRAHLNDEDPTVRRAAVDATRARAGELVDELLVRVADTDLSVQREALVMLARVKLEDRALEALSEIVLAGRVAKPADDALLAALAASLRPSPAILRMLNFVEARQRENQDLATRARRLAAQLASAT